MNKLIILDRDGVVNWETSTELGTGRITHPDEWEELPGSLEAIVRLKKAGFIVCIATNQSIVGKNIITQATLDEIHNKMQKKLKAKGASIDKIFFCPHRSVDNCLCRKPKPGMLLAAAKAFNIDYIEQQIPFVGDSDIDLLAAVAAGFLPVLVRTGKGLKTLEKINTLNIRKIMIFDDLSAFTDYWLSQPASNSQFII